MKTSLLLILTLYFSVLQAQEVVTTAGATLNNSNGSISFTIGESVANTLINNDKTLTQGFHQPGITIVKLTEHKDTDFSVSVYPNPVAGELTLKIGKGTLSDIQLRLFDINGKLIISQDIEKNETQIPVVELQNGFYILKVYEGSNEIISFKIIKK